MLEVDAHRLGGAVGTAVAEGFHDVAVLAVVAAAQFGRRGTALETSPHRQRSRGVHDVEQRHQQTVVRGHRDGTVQQRVGAFETLEVLRRATGVQDLTDAGEVGLGGHPGSEHGDLRLQQPPDLARGSPCSPSERAACPGSKSSCA
nr:hypothetical protein [Amycolatopsis methanolica]